MLFEFSQAWEREEDQFAEKQTCGETFFFAESKENRISTLTNLTLMDRYEPEK